MPRVLWGWDATGGVQGRIGKASRPEITLRAATHSTGRRAGGSRRLERVPHRTQDHLPQRAMRPRRRADKVHFAQCLS